MLVVGVDFGEAVFCGGCQTDGIGGTEVGGFLHDNISCLFQRGAIITKPEAEKSAIWRAISEGEFDGGTPVEAFREAGGGNAVGVEAAEILEVFALADEVG